MKFFTTIFSLFLTLSLSAQQNMQQLLNDTTDLKWREASVSWYFGGQKALYRKRHKVNNETTVWKRYQFSLNGKGLLSKTRDFTQISSIPSTIYSLNAALGLGREKRKPVSKSLNAFKWYYGYEIAPTLTIQRERSNLARVSSGGVVTIFSTDLDSYTGQLAFTPLAGIRYDFNARFGLGLETSATVQAGVEYLHAKDETTFVGGTYKTSGYGLVYSAYTTPIRALWLSYTF